MHLKKLISGVFSLVMILTATAKEIKEIIFSTDKIQTQSSQYEVYIERTTSTENEYRYYQFFIRDKNSSKTWQSSEKNFNPYVAIEKDWGKLQKVHPDFNDVVRTEVCKKFTEFAVKASKLDRAAYQKRIFVMGSFFKCELDGLAALGFELPRKPSIIPSL
jgi:hypothetical protein